MLMHIVSVELIEDLVLRLGAIFNFTVLALYSLHISSVANQNRVFQTCGRLSVILPGARPDVAVGLSSLAKAVFW